MKKTLHEEVLYRLRWENISGSNFHMIGMEQKRTRLVYVAFSLCLFLTTGVLFAQPGSTKKEEENLNVFHDWITWNNPGSLVLNHLNRQAEDYYTIRDKQIAGLKTKGDWKNTDQVTGHNRSA